MTDVTNNGAGQTNQRSPKAGLQNAAQTAATELQNAAQTAATEFQARAGQAREWATHQTDVARQTVVERPYASAGAAFAAGLVFGLLLARR